MANNQEIDEQQALLTLHRRTLGTYLKREAICWRSTSTRSHAWGIIEARNEIRRIKSMLRVWGVDVEDNSNDEPHVEDNSNDKPVKYHQVAKHSLLLSRSSLILSAIICVFVTLIFVIMVYRWNIYTDFLMKQGAYYFWT